MLAGPAKFSGICTNIAAITSLRKEMERRVRDLKNPRLLVSWGKESMYTLRPRVSCSQWFPFYKEVADRAGGSMTGQWSPLRAMEAHRFLPCQDPGVTAQGASAGRCCTTVRDKGIGKFTVEHLPIIQKLSRSLISRRLKQRQEKNKSLHFLRHIFPL